MNGWLILVFYIALLFALSGLVWWLLKLWDEWPVRELRRELDTWGSELFIDDVDVTEEDGRP